MSNVLLVAVGAALEQRIAGIRDHRIIAIDRERLTDFEDLRRSGETYDPDIILVGSNVSGDYALKYAESVSLTSPYIPVVLVAEPTPELLLQAMRAGVRDVISQSATDDELVAVLSLAADSRPQRKAAGQAASGTQPRDRGRIVVVVSPKGGVGKTTISANLAVALASGAPNDTVLVDLDLQFGDVSTVLDLTPTFTLADAFSQASGDTLLLKTYLTVHPSGFFVLCGANSPADTEKVSGDQIGTLIKQLASQFKYVIIDTAAGIPEATLSALEQASDFVVVSSMDVSCVRAVRKELDVLTELGLTPLNRHVVLNFVDRRSGLSVRDVEGVIGVPVDVVVPRSSEVQIAANRGEPFMLRKKTGSLQKAIRVLVSRVQFQLTQDRPRRHHKGVDFV